MMKKKLNDPKYENLVLIKTINDNGGLTNWIIEPFENLEANYFDTKKRMNQIASKYDIKTNIFDDILIDNMKKELNKTPSETSEEDLKENKETDDVLFVCECGSKFKKFNLRHHIKTQKHIDFIKNKQDNETASKSLVCENNTDKSTKLEVVNLKCIDCVA